ncbi:tRNA methyltransferase [Helicobacter sp. L8]|uniref:tRNA methyltransferase n=1 Tax=Helicobacter sp. L8 TaxID=2316078 RepID=UPI001F099795|nr:tRNA methyltransferase [Helicobacter sp. L8]
MIRLLLLSLLLLNLQAKENTLAIFLHFVPIGKPQESQNTSFFKAFKALYDYIDKSFRKIEPEDPNERQPYFDRLSELPDYTDASIPLAKAVVKQIPLLHEFKPKNQREVQFLAHVKDMEMLHILDAIDVFTPRPIYPRVTPKIAAHMFLDSVAFLYTPLFNAHKAGLDVIAYLKQLHKEESSEKTMASFDMHQIGLFNTDRYYEKEKNIVPHKPFRKRLDQDMYNVGELMRTFQLYWGEWTSVVVNKILNSGIPSTFVFENEFDEFVSKNAQRIDPEHLSDLFTARVIPLNRNAPFYDLLRNDDPKILKDTLKDHPTMCLSPKYLSPKSQQTCQQLFDTQTYNTKDIQEQLHLVRLISIDESPCVYLDPKDKLQIFKSSDALCLALQKHLEKGF